MKNIFLHKPSVLRLVPGLNNDNPVVTVFECEEDATAFWKADDEMDNLYDLGSGFNHLYINGEIKVDYFENVTIRYWSHSDLQNYLDLLYANWCLNNNWQKLDREAGLYVCGDDLFDEEYLLLDNTNY